MSEIKKNIETCRGEDVLAEVSALPQDPHFGSLVNEALDPMQQQALHQAGYDGYSEVIAQHKPYTFASSIIQMKSNLLLLLRALWQFPFGSGTLRSLSDMWQHYITRLQGNETYGIPSRLSDLTDLPSAPLLLADRKIGNGGAENDGIEYGISLARLLCDTTAAASVTELIDDNTWDEYLQDAQSDITSKFPNLDKLTFGAMVIKINSKYIVLFDKNLSYLYFPNLEEFYGVMTTTSFSGAITNSNAITSLNMPSLKKIDVYYSELGPTSRQFAVQVAKGCTALKEVLMPSLTYMTPNMGTNYENYLFTSCPNIEKMVFGKLTAFNPWVVQYALDTPMANLIHLEFGAGVAISLDLSYWNPTNALDASLDTLVTDEDCHNNLEQFLKNFRTYIALRLADNGSGLTLTLSAAVFSSIWDANGNPQVLGDGLDQLRADIHNIVKTTKHWDVNKAN